MVIDRRVGETQRPIDYFAKSVRRYPTRKTSHPNARDDGGVRTRPDSRTHPARAVGESAPGRVYALGVSLLRLSVFAQTAWLCPASRHSPGGSRSRPPALSGAGGRTTELSATDQASQRGPHSYALEEKPGLAPGDGQKHSHQSRVYRRGPV